MAWRNADAQTIEDEDDFYIALGHVLTSEDQAQRIDRLLWAGRTAPAQRILPRVDAGYRALGEARVALRQLNSNAQHGRPSSSRVAGRSGTGL